MPENSTLSETGDETQRVEALIKRVRGMDLVTT